MKKRMSRRLSLGKETLTRLGVLGGVPTEDTESIWIVCPFGWTYTYCSCDTEFWCPKP